jgi:hypothetical protein
VLSFFIGDVSDDTPHLVAFMSTTGAGVGGKGFMFARTGLGATSLSFEGFDFGIIEDKAELLRAVLLLAY